MLPQYSEFVLQGSAAKNLLAAFRDQTPVDIQIPGANPPLVIPVGSTDFNFADAAFTECLKDLATP